MHLFLQTPPHNCYSTSCNSATYANPHLLKPCSKARCKNRQHIQPQNLYWWTARYHKSEHLKEALLPLSATTIIYFQSFCICRPCYFRILRADKPNCSRPFTLTVFECQPNYIFRQLHMHALFRDPNMCFTLETEVFKTRGFIWSPFLSIQDLRVCWYICFT